MKTLHLTLALCAALLLAAPPVHADDEPTWGGRPLSHWLEQLKQGETGLGQAPEALIAIGKPALPGLRRALMGTNPNARRNAATVLGHMGGSAETLVPDLAELLSDEHLVVRTAAALAIGRVARTVDADSASLESTERLVAAAARLKEHLDDPQDAVRTAVVQGMALMGGFSQDDLRALLVDPKRRRGAFDAIAKLGPEATELSINLLRHPSWHVRKWTLRHLRTAQLDPRSWLPALADATHDESEAVAMAALQHLGARLRTDDEATTLTVRALESPHAMVRTWTPMALAHAKRIGPGATRALLKAMQADDAVAQEGAAWALGQSTTDRDAVVAALSKRISAKAPRVRWSAARSLVELGETPDAALPALRDALLASPVERPYRVQLAPGHELSIGRKKWSGWIPRPRPDTAWPSILAFEEDGSAYLREHLPDAAPERWHAIHALARFEANAVPHLQALLRDRDPETRRRAALTLATLKDDSFACLPSLLAALEPRGDRDDAEVSEEPVIHDGENEDAIDWHETALEAIKGLGPKAVAPALEHLAAARPNDQKRLQPGLRAWLVTVGKKAVPHLEALRADFELGAWIDGVVNAIEAKAEEAAAKKKAKEKPKDK
ncbi:MAG: HEAT repeat domain-containing protein [Planctomycetota bacterium]|nr:HEAT repeat domain-containing protein [Planctomycetota bacterium]